MSMRSGPLGQYRMLGMRGRAIPEREILGQGGALLHEPSLIPRRISGHEGIGCLFEYRVEAVTAHPLLFPSDQEN
ncbi:hypothetical protein ACFSHT_21545, partial [Paraburkholderia silviterrae]